MQTHTPVLTSNLIVQNMSQSSSAVVINTPHSTQLTNQNSVIPPLEAVTSSRTSVELNEKNITDTVHLLMKTHTYLRTQALPTVIDETAKQFNLTVQQLIPFEKTGKFSEILLTVQ